MTTITVSELAAESAELLPGRETLLGDFNFAEVLASNTSLAANVMTICSSANSLAYQSVYVSQG
ncbi:hypothetical protein GCM10012320_17020 [Sinomonas cellulolyticus]|jgi:hypothetical protein|uniref:Uncharacterized protein n=1 Tax=Sinomonas cellulolyticus TaxID=2801916 RepID=A0ABS1JYQ4_9MICC|nr:MULTISPECIES: hypothetical protein [Sinomonas]MBL0704526.1 hypothetical protein [Sinomonas cellulolyticus]GHG49188.1 hypothetical protein GCM10012320_17020 [Sinomonas sp. KCTC 49339]